MTANRRKLHAEYTTQYDKVLVLAVNKLNTIYRDGFQVCLVRRHAEFSVSNNETKKSRLRLQRKKSVTLK